ncbi:MAG: hypothetical protein LKG23_01080 [Nitrospira sp.]|jgi:hypothetical protein|nr:hypothetical protein [Nitrospira sp.]
MVITLRESDPEGICPASYSRLARQLNASLFNLNHGLRHPFGIYGISLGKCAGRFEDVIKALDPFLSVVNSRQVRAEWFDPLLDAEERLLYSLEEHFDDCFSVLDCFFVETNMRKSNGHVKGFAKRLRPYSKPIGELVNKLKHKNARLRGILLSQDSEIVPGYFLEGIHPDGSIGPDPSIHGGPFGLTAFSFFRDLRRHFVNLFVTSTYLAEVLDQVGAKTCPDDGSKHTWGAELGKQVAALPTTYYPNEVELPNPWMEYAGEEKSTPTLTLSLGNTAPCAKSFRAWPRTSEFEVRVIYRGDSVTRSFKLPYSG